jgi:hypothetical protein
MENLICALSEQERQSIYECLCAAEREDIFPKWEFETLFGIDRKKLTHVREIWPEVDASNPDVGAAIVGAMGHLLGYPSGQNMRWENHISVSPENIKVTLDKLLELGL